MRELNSLVAPKPPQGVLVRGHAGLVINKLSRRWQVCDDLLLHWDEELLRPKPSLTRALLRTYGRQYLRNQVTGVPR